MAENENATGQPVENTPTQTLFRFTSLRSPQLSDDKDQNKRFVLIPQDLKDDTRFYKPVTEGTRPKRVLLQERAAAYAPTTECIAKDKTTNNLDTFKRSYKVIYDFATWLARNKSTCTYKEFIIQKNAVLTAQHVKPSEIILWNNLIYQVVTQKDFYIKEVMMQSILALHALLNPTTDEDETKVLLNARVVLPKELMLDEKTLPVSNTVSRMAKASESKITPPTEEMKKQQAISISKTKLSNIENLKKNLSATEKQYSKEYQSSYASQEERYQDLIAPIIERYNKEVENAKAEYCGVRPPEQEYDPKDPCRQPKEIPYPKLPKFEFNFRDEVSSEYLTASLKPDNLDTLLDVLGHDFTSEATGNQRIAEKGSPDLEALLDGRNTFLELTSVITETTDKLNRTIIENTDGDNEVYTSIGGVILPVARTVAAAFTYQICPKYVKDCTLDISLTVPDSSWDVSQISYALTPSNSSASIDKEYFVKSRTGNTIFLSNLYSPGLHPSIIENSTLRVKIVFSNGRVTEIFVQGINTRTCRSGDFMLEVEENDNPVIIDDEHNFIPSGFGFKNIGIADYLKVEQSTHAYVEGEVAHIENVMAREYREKSTRRLRRSENTTTSSSDTEREQINDTTTANRFEMQTEISKMMQEASDTAMSANAHLGFTKSYTLDLGANYSNHKSKEESTRQAVTQAQDVTSRAMDRIVNKIHEERIEKIIEEFEENNSHGLDNRKGDKHVVGVYRWVDKLMKNQIYNYGKRMMFEFMVPEPAQLNILGLTSSKKADQTTLVKPQDPRVEGVMQVSNYSQLSELKLRHWVSKYNVELNEKLEDSKVITFAFSDRNIGQDVNSVYGRWSGVQHTNDFKIPENYCATNVKGKISVGIGAGAATMRPFSSVNICGIEVGDNVNLNLPNIQAVIPISSLFWDVRAMSGSLYATCELTEEYKKQWLQKTFKAIIDAYEEALVEYNNKVSEEQDKAVVIKDSNPNFYRQIENTVLRKNCISYMADRAVGSTHGYGLSGLTQGNTFTDYETNLTSTLDKYTAFVKFMEQAFEWENISYYLYPYYWGNKQNWSDLYKAENTDPLFRAFLQSGMARVVATVRPGFEDAVQFYLATGKIWNGGEVPVIGDELYLSIVDEMKEPKGLKQGKAWLTRLPTTLNILQAESIGLKVAHALPFTAENPDDFEVPSEVITEEKFNFEKNDSLLGVKPDSSEEKIISGDWV